MKSVFVLLFLCSAALSFAQLNPVRVESPPTIDADLSDWDDAVPLFVDHTHVADATDIDNDADLSMSVRLAYDADNVYLAIEVSDEEIIFDKTPDTLFESDTIEFWLNENQYGVAMVEGRPVWYQFPWVGIETDVSTGSYMLDYTDTGYVAELAIPRTMIAAAMGSEVAVSTFPFAVGVDDSDVVGAERQGQIYYPAGWGWGDTSTYATVQLGE